MLLHPPPEQPLKYSEERKEGRGKERRKDRNPCSTSQMHLSEDLEEANQERGNGNRAPSSEGQAQSAPCPACTGQVRWDTGGGHREHRITEKLNEMVWPRSRILFLKYKSTISSLETKICSRKYLSQYEMTGPKKKRTSVELKKQRNEFQQKRK